MIDITMRRWKEAEDIAYRAMGAKSADIDPLALWCLTELIYFYGQRASRSRVAPTPD